MATAAQPVRIGPWPGGINVQSDPTAISDDEAVEITNFDIDIDGSLKSRPSIIPSASVGARYDNRIIGIFSILPSTHYVVFTSTDSAGANPSTNAYNLSTGVVTTITNTIAATSMVQFQNKAWLVASPNQANPGGNWDGTTFTAVAAMPKGVSICTYKERLWIASGDMNVASPSIIYYNGLDASGSNPTIWNAEDNIVVNNGDGQGIRKIYSFSGSIVIFKTRSTYVFAYEADPKKGQVQIVSATVGIDGLGCMTENQSVMYVISGGDVYSINNWVWEQLNIKVPFAFVDTNSGNWSSHCTLSSVGNRVIARYYDSYYIYNTSSRTWTRWVTALTPNSFWKSPIVDTVTGIDQYLCGNYLKSGANSPRMFAMKDAVTNTEAETYTCTLKTKVYSMNVPYSFKRLMWWGIDLLAKSNVIVTAIPVSYGVPVYWKQLPPRRWADMPPGTWGAPLDVSITVSDNTDIKNGRGVRMFVKYIKSLRFRQIQFVISSQTDGTSQTSPFQLYSVTAYVINKQLVPAKIN